MADFLFKTEPSEYSFADLQAKGQGVWDGVRNPVALRNMRDMKKGDRVCIYMPMIPELAAAVLACALCVVDQPRIRLTRLPVG